MKELIELIEARNRSSGVPHAVATVLRVEGSSYRRPGARMLLNVHGRVAGSVSGGCLEKSVISEAKAALLDNRPRLISFDTTDQDDLAFGSSLGCQGKIWIGIEVLKAGQEWPLEQTVEHVRKQRKPAALITRIAQKNDNISFESDAVFTGTFEAGYQASIENWGNEIEEVFRSRKSKFFGAEMRDAAFIEWLAPPVSLLIFGGGPDVPSLVRLAHNVGHEITVIDRRTDFALPKNFPGADRVIFSRPDRITEHFRPDERTVAVVMNHHYDTDRDVLSCLLPLGLPYIAVLGPRRRTERIISELENSRFFLSEENRDSIHAPAGLDLGAESPEQIALSILAEIQATLSGRQGGMLKFRPTPIHTEILPLPELSCASRE